MSAAAKDVTFADLIRQREAQQRRIRESLEIQNKQLRERLGFVASGKTGAGNEDYTPGIPAEEFVQFVSELREMINKAHEADIAAFHSLRDRVDVQNALMMQKIAELETKLVTSEQARDLLREEQANQCLTLSGEIDDLRALLDASVKRFEGRDEILTQTIAAVHALNETAAGFEKKFAEVDAQAQALRLEAQEVERRFQELLAQNKAEQTELTHLRNDTLKDQQQVITTLIRDAEEQLVVMKNNAEALIEDTRHHHSIIGTLVDERIEPMKAELDAHYRQLIHKDLQEYLEHYAAAGAEQIVEAHSTKLAFLQMETSVKLALTSMKEKYDAAVEKQLRDVVDHAKSIEDERRREFPTTDSERVELMVKELEGAFVMLEGIIRNNVTQHRSCPLLPRVEKLEAVVDELDVKTTLDHRPRIMFSVDVQTALQPESSVDPAERVQTVVERHLKYELDVAAAEASTRNVTIAVDRALQNSQATGSSSSPTALSTGRSLGPLSPNGAAAAGKRSDLAALQEARQQKEAAVAKVQAVLREIQAKFQELTAKDPATFSSRSSSADAKQIAALIARQKEAVYQKERQLVDQRNKLWREIADLDERIASCP